MASEKWPEVPECHQIWAKTLWSGDVALAFLILPQRPVGKPHQQPCVHHNYMHWLMLYCIVIRNPARAGTGTLRQALLLVNWARGGQWDWIRAEEALSLPRIACARFVHASVPHLCGFDSIGI